MSCVRCDGPAERREIEATDGSLAAFGDACEPCFKAMWREFYRLRRTYRHLVKSGIHPKIAGQIMCRIVDSPDTRSALVGA